MKKSALNVLLIDAKDAHQGNTLKIIYVEFVVAIVNYVTIIKFVNSVKKVTLLILLINVNYVPLVIVIFAKVKIDAKHVLEVELYWIIIVENVLNVMITVYGAKIFTLVKLV